MSTLLEVLIWGPLSVVKLGKPIQLYATAYYSDYSDPTVSGAVFTISDPTIASVDSSGLVTGLVEGSTTISCTYNGVSSAQYNIFVVDSLESIAVSGQQSYLLNSTAQLTATGTWSSGFTRNISNIVEWNSDNKNSVTISTSGFLTVHSAGTANITCKYNEIYSANFPISVEATLVSIAVSGLNQFSVDSPVQLVATGTYNDGSTQNISNIVTWSSTNQNIQISSSGVMTSNKASTANISCTYNGVISNSIAVQSEAVLTSIEISGNNSVSINNGEQLLAVGFYNDSSTKNLTILATWNSSNSSVMTIASNGYASGLAVGTSNVSCSYSGITSNSLAITVS